MGSYIGVACPLIWIIAVVFPTPNPLMTAHEPPSRVWESGLRGIGGLGIRKRFQGLGWRELRASEAFRFRMGLSWLKAFQILAAAEV